MSSVPYRRRSIRLRDYDYRQEGAYFITICTFQRACILGSIADGVMELNENGKLAVEEWEQTAIARSYVELDAFVVMPNHFHGILVITGDTPAGKIRTWHAMSLHQPRQFSKPVARSIPTIIGSFKSAVTKRINRIQNTPGERIWQPNYHEHIIRSEASLNKLRLYVEQNPAIWNEDKLHPMKHSSW